MILGTIFLVLWLAMLLTRQRLAVRRRNFRR